MAARFPALAALLLIRLYRYTLSSVAGRTCRHLPTCSEFGETAIRRFGLWAGGWMTFARISRCRPFGTHGFDPVPTCLPGNAAWFLPWRYGLWRSCTTPDGPGKEAPHACAAHGGASGAKSAPAARNLA
nr:membrane protein insertion efficiency factor YidD [Faunimonas pinastri]